jgi:hypothetical protein
MNVSSGSLQYLFELKSNKLMFKNTLSVQSPSQAPHYICVCVCVFVMHSKWTYMYCV